MTANKAQQAAQQLIQERSLTVPIDIKALLLDHRVFTREEAMEKNMSGMLVVQGDIATAVVNRDHSMTRKRFTLAHELGHFILHKDSSSVFIDSSPIFYRDEQSAQGLLTEEVEANAFAAELLMPENWLREKVADLPLDYVTDEAGVARLAQELQVSVQALSIRLGKLGLVNM